MGNELLAPTPAEGSRGPDQHARRHGAVGEVRAPLMIAGVAGRARRLDSARLAAEQRVHGDAIARRESANFAADLDDVADTLVTQDERKGRER